MDFAELCERASRNDPELTVCKLDDTFNNEQASRLGDAARRNTMISELTLNISLLTEDGADFQSLLDFIERSPSLTNFYVHGTDSASITHQFVHAISRNNKVTLITLTLLRLGADSLTILLRSPRCVFDQFGLLWCTVVSRNGYGAQEVISAFRENHTLKGLSIGDPNDLLLDCLQGLESHPTLQTLSLWGGRQDDAIEGVSVNAIARIVSSPGSSLQLLFFKGCKFQDRLLEPLVQALNSSVLFYVCFKDGCSFDATAKESLETMFRKNVSMEAKFFVLKVDGPINLGSISETSLFFSTLLQEKSSRLAGLVFDDAVFGFETADFERENADAEGDSRLIMTAIIRELRQNRALVALHLGQIDGDLCRILAESIPKMKRLETLKFAIDITSATTSPSEQEWLRVFESNSSLTHVEIRGFEFSERGREVMQYLSQRNKNLEPLLESPPSTEMPLSLRPTLYHAALKTQSGTALVLRDLVSLGNTICDKSRRKRRRPNYYSPSNPCK